MPLLDIRQGEGRKVSLLLLHSFCNGVALSVLISAAPALFLKEFGSKALPYCYIATALVVPFLGFGCMRLASKVSFGRLLTVNLAFVIGGLLLFRLLFMAGLGRMASAMIVTWVDIQTLLVALEFDSLAGSLFDLRQGKRIFPIIGAGEVIAGIIGGLAVPVVAPLVGAENLLWISVAALCGAMVILQVLRPGNEAAPSASDEASSGRSAGAARKLGPLSIGLIVTAALADIASYFGDNIYYTQLSEKYANPEQMAGFIGVYLASAGGLALAVRLLVTPWIYQRFGITLGLLVGPILTFSIAITVVAVMGSALGGAAIVFWSAAALKLNDDVHRKSNHRTGIFLLLQALPLEDRIRTQTIQEGIVGSMIGGVAGALLLVLNRWTLMAAPCALALFALGWCLWVLTLRKPYLETVASSLKQQMLLSNTTLVLDATGRQMLCAYLHGNDPALILYAMHMIENTDVDPADLERLLRHDVPEIRIQAARMFARRAVTGDMQIIADRIKVESEARVLGELIQAGLTIDPEPGLAIARQHMETGDLSVRSVALIGIFRQRVGRADAEDVLRKLAGSSSLPERLAAVRIIDDAAGGSMSLLLLKLLSDTDASVRRAAARAAGRIRIDAIAGRLLELLQDPECQKEAIGALRDHGGSVLGMIQPELESGSRSSMAQKAMFRVLGHINSPESRAVLWEHLGRADIHSRGVILEALVACRVPASAKQAVLVRQVFREEVANAVKARDMLNGLPTGEMLADLMGASIVEDRKRALRRALDAIGLLYQGTEFEAAKPYLLEATDAHMNMALETIDTLFAMEDRTLLVPALATAPAPSGGELPSVDTATAAIQEGIRDIPNPEASSFSLLTQYLGVRWLASAGPAHAGMVARRQEELLRLLGAPSGMLPGLDAAEIGEFIQRFALFARLEIFSGVGFSSLAQLVQKAVRREFAPGQTFIRMDEQGRSMFVITEGRIRVHRGDVTVAELGAGAIVGEMSVIDPEPRSASATALAPAKALELGCEALQAVMREHFDLSRALMKMLATRYRNVTA